MTDPADLRDAVARVGALVRAVHRQDAAHTDRGRVLALNRFAPVALMRFACGCIAYVPLRRLALDVAAPLPTCQVLGCRNPGWPPPYCTNHATKEACQRDADGPSFEPGAAPMAGSKWPSARSGRAIDDAGNPDRAAASSPPAPRRGAARPGRVAAPPPSPGWRVGRPQRWTRERCIAAITAHVARHGSLPTADGWRRCASDEFPSRSSVARVFGSWSAAIEAAGFSPRSAGRPRG